MSSRSEPQLFEVADGSIALMEGSDACGKCDPPYAGKHEPWVGTFGGAGHDHREEPEVEQTSTKPPH